MMGLLEESPDTVDLETIGGRLSRCARHGELRLFGEHAVRFDPAVDLRFHREQMYPDAGVVTHPNGMRFTSLDAGGKVLFEQVYYSVGGGIYFVGGGVGVGRWWGEEARCAVYVFQCG